MSSMVLPHRSDPVVLPGSNNPDMTDHVCGIALRQRAFTWWWFVIAPFGLLCVVLLGSILWLFYAGLGIWGIDWPVVWGFAIINYVWWIAIASGGTFISALFYLTRSDWRSSVTRRIRRLSLTAYVEWVLGPSRSASAQFVTTEIDVDTGAMFARNPWNAAFGSRIAFADLAGRQTDWTGDRQEFIGRNGTLESPAALDGKAPLFQQGRRWSRSMCGIATIDRAAAEHSC
jgi:hypothetical protein